MVNADFENPYSSLDKVVVCACSNDDDDGNSLINLGMFKMRWNVFT